MICANQKKKKKSTWAVRKWENSKEAINNSPGEKSWERKDGFEI